VGGGCSTPSLPWEIPGDPGSGHVCESLGFDPEERSKGDPLLQGQGHLPTFWKLGISGFNDLRVGTALVPILCLGRNEWSLSPYLCSKGWSPLSKYSSSPFVLDGSFEYP
jgi:hypothetical protein